MRNVGLLGINGEWNIMNEINTPKESPQGADIMKRNCPRCNKDLIYSSKKGYDCAIKNNTLCISCKCKEVAIRDKKVKISEIRSRLCPSCQKIMTYVKKSALNAANNKNSKCKKCALTDRNVTWGENISKGKIGKGKFSDERKIQYSNMFMGDKNPNYKNKWSDEQRKKLGNGRIGNKWSVGRKYTTQTLQKMRISSLNYLAKTGVGIRYNNNACLFLENINNKTGNKFTHATNGGEMSCIGYSIDGYEKLKNIIFEYDEKHHYVNGKLRQKDENRMIELISHLHCRFLRYNEKTGKIFEYFLDKPSVEIQEIDI